MSHNRYTELAYLQGPGKGAGKGERRNRCCEAKGRESSYHRRWHPPRKVTLCDRKGCDGKAEKGKTKRDEASPEIA